MEPHHKDSYCIQASKVSPGMIRQSNGKEAINRQKSILQVQSQDILYKK
jgi:hypothetical protein